MKKLLLFFALLCAVAQGAWAQASWSVWNGGEIYFTHEPANPPTVVDNWVQINSADDLVYVTLNWNRCLDGRTDLGVYYRRNYQLNVNLDFTSVTWKPLGYYGHGEHEDKGLEGFFNGNGHTIKLKIENTSENNQGLFHEIHSSGKVWNLHVDCDIRVDNARLVGGIAGENYGTIENCWVSGHIESSHYSQYDADLGGIAGLNEDEGDILYCCVTADVKNTGGNSGVGGIAGSNEGEIYHVTFYGDVSVNHAQYNKYVGKQNQQATLEYYYDTFNQTEYNTAGPEDQNQELYARAIKYTYDINVTTVGQGSLTVSAGGENNVPGARKGQEVTLTTPSGINADVTVTDADGNNVMLFGSSSASGYSFIMPKSDVNVHAVFSVPNWPGCTTGTGESGDPYIIDSADDWNEFALSVNAGNTHSSKYVKLTSNISTWMMAGASETNSFQGTFDGDGHTLTVSHNTTAAVTAPFRFTNNATISNLRVAGTISTIAMQAAGIVAQANGSLNLTNCRSSVTINSSRESPGAYHGGLVGWVAEGGSATISGCVFDGALVSVEGTGKDTECGGFVAMSEGSTTITNSLLNPSSVSDGMVIGTFIGASLSNTITNCYYTQAYGTVQGTASYFGTATAPSGLGNLVTDYGMVKAYDNGLLFNNKYYTAPSTGAGTENCPYIIDSEAALALLAQNVNTGVSDFLDKHFSLTCDLDLSGQNWMPIGTTDRPFKGNFNGNNHIIRNMAVNNPSGDYNGLFGWVEGDINYETNWTDPGSKYIKNFVVKNANVHGRNYTGGVAGRVHGELTFENVILDGATVQGANFTSGFIGSAEGDYQQSLYISNYSELHLNNCLFVNGSVTENTGHEGYDYVAPDHPHTSFVMFGNIQRYAIFNNNYFSNVTYNGGTAPEDYYNVKAYPITPDVPSGVSCNIYNTTGISYDGSHYAPNNTTAHFTVAYNDFLHVITGVSVNGSQVGTSAGNYDFTIDGSQAQAYTITVTFRSGDSEEDPYLITNADDWDSFATHVNNGNNFSGKFVKLTSNISVSSMVGTDDANSFQGTFDGDGHKLTFTKGTSLEPFDENYCAPFRHVKNAVIKNLHVDGTIYTSAQKAAGIVGESHGNLGLAGCRSSININSSVSGDGTHGGLVSTLSGSNNLILIQGCVFDGSFATTAGTTNCGGFIGWPVYNKPIVNSSLMKPSSVDAGMLINTFARWHEGYEPTISYCYYVATDDMPVNQGTQTYAFATAPANLGSLTVDYDMVKAYENGILFDGTYYVTSTGNISLTVEGYGTGNDKWAFIASPVNSNIAPTTVSNIFSATEYDLYRLNPSSSTWENYKQHNGDFNIVNGQGYLYATKETKTLVFSGTFNIDNQKMVGLSTGFNLVGNPFVVEAYANRSYYKMNTAGTDIEVVENYAENPIPACTGIVVRATGPYESITFSTSAPQQQSANNNGNLQITLTKVGVRNDAFQDKAIVSFNEGSELEKFVFNERNAKLYIPQNGEDYAIAFSDKRGEVPVNFKAKETGRYTITVETCHGASLQGIKLIDKFENKIIDLNINNSYTFIGSSVDDHDRFLLVFKTSEFSDGSEIFAYQSGNDIVVSGDGELQVFDVMGRMVMNQQVNGVETCHGASLQTGVYIFRLNGKTQKIVVR